MSKRAQRARLHVTQQKTKRSKALRRARRVGVTGTVALTGAGLVLGASTLTANATGPVSVAMISDINPGSHDGYPVGMTAFNGAMYFSADDGTDGTELWKTDGTAAGTQLVKDIEPGPGGSNPFNLTVADNTLYFTATTTDGRGLWKTDGTSTGTTLIKTLGPETGLAPSGLTALGNSIIFAADDGTNGNELWVSDGTTAGTSMVMDIYPGSHYYGPGMMMIRKSDPSDFTAIGGTVYFSANDGTHGRELWKTDGTAAGTAMVADINPGTAYSSPQHLTDVGGTLYFTATDPTAGQELWKSDGTAAGTTLVKDIATGTHTLPASMPGTTVEVPNGSYESALTNVAGKLWFIAFDGQGRDVWTSDGTANGTTKLTDLRSGTSADSTQFVTIGATTFFAGVDPTEGTELWKSDGTPGGTVLVKDIAPGADSYGVPASSTPQQLTAVGNELFFSADDGTHGRELWQSDGTEQGTVLTADIWPGTGTYTYGGTTTTYNNSGAPWGLTTLGSALMFAASDGTHGTELWEASAPGDTQQPTPPPTTPPPTTPPPTTPPPTTPVTPPGTTPPAPTPGAPSNAFTFAAGKATTKGTGSFAVTLPSAGTVTLTPSGGSPLTPATVTGNGQVTVPVKLTTAGLKKLRAKLRLAKLRGKKSVSTTLSGTLTFTPTGGTPKAVPASFTVVLR